ncbi:MAG: hypothetical protein FWD11_00240 [Micrococcales bacterium]|nr:hypothetical protein [Micrococcales bacterium]
MSTWQTASLSGVAERTDGHPRRDVRERVLDVAQQLVDARGLTVGLGHLSFEEVITKAEVSRTTAYRVWPRKERFLEDLLRRLADTCSPCHGDADQETTEVALATLRGLVDDLATQAGRRIALVEVCRVTGAQSFEDMRSSPKWTTYVALIATMRSLGDEALTQELRERMRHVEDEAVAFVAAACRHIGGLTGFRLRTIPGDYSTVAHLGAAAMEGMLLLADIRPTIPSATARIDPFGTGRLAEWSLPAIAYTSAMIGVLEPDPDFNLEEVRAILGSAGRDVGADEQSHRQGP